MQKRKYKLNVLDIVIFIVAICSVIVVMFRDNINGFFGTDEIAMIDITLDIEDSSSPQAVLVTMGKSVVFEPETATEIKADALIKKAVDSSKGDDSSSKFVITCTGYKKFGRYFTENGDRISIGSNCKITIEGIEINCKVVTVSIE